MTKHKFGAKPCKSGEIKFPSKLERDYYNKLKALQRSGEILFFLRQPVFDLGAGLTYKADFVEYWSDGEVVFTDCKGVETKEFIRSKKLVESLYPIQLNIVKKI